MTANQLRELLEGLPPDAPVLFRDGEGFHRLAGEMAEIRTETREFRHEGQEEKPLLNQWRDIGDPERERDREETVVNRSGTTVRIKTTYTDWENALVLYR